MVWVFFNSTHIRSGTTVDQPALMGQSEGIRTIAAYRYQWVGIERCSYDCLCRGRCKLPLKNISGGVFSHICIEVGLQHIQVQISLLHIPYRLKEFSEYGCKAWMIDMMLDGSG